MAFFRQPHNPINLLNRMYFSCIRPRKWGGGKAEEEGGEGKKKEKEEKEFHGSNSRFHARRHYFMSDPTKNYSNYIFLLAERIETRGERCEELVMDVY